MADKDANTYHLEEAEQQAVPGTITQDWSESEEKALVYDSNARSEYNICR
jgi:nucleoside diphosphate kinase